jgi:hypothetical protein
VTGSDVGTWIGTAFSIIGAGIAIWQARQAISAATRAKQMRDEIAERNTHSELSSLSGILTAAIRAMDKYGPGVRATVRRGSSPDSDASAVRALTAEMDRHRAMLTETFGAASDLVRIRLNDLLAEFGAAVADANRVAKGCEIYTEITTFSGNMKQALDSKIFSKGDVMPRIRAF